MIQGDRTQADELFAQIEARTESTIQFAPIRVIRSFSSMRFVPHRILRVLSISVRLSIKLGNRLCLSRR